MLARPSVSARLLSQVDFAEQPLLASHMISVVENPTMLYVLEEHLPQDVWEVWKRAIGLYKKVAEYKQAPSILWSIP